jgi:hypothetical protein
MATRDPTPHIEDLPRGDTLSQYHTSPPPRTDVNDSESTAELSSRRGMTPEPLQMLRLYIFGLFDVCQRRASSISREGDHRRAYGMDISIDQVDLRPASLFQWLIMVMIDVPRRVRTLLRVASEINADLREFNIIIGTRDRGPYNNPQAMAVDTSNIPIISFHPSFAVALSRISNSVSGRGTVLITSLMNFLISQICQAIS